MRCTKPRMQFHKARLRMAAYFGAPVDPLVVIKYSTLLGSIAAAIFFDSSILGHSDDGADGDDDDDDDGGKAQATLLPSVGNGRSMKMVGKSNFNRSETSVDVNTTTAPTSLMIAFNRSRGYSCNQTALHQFSITQHVCVRMNLPD